MIVEAEDLIVDIILFELKNDRAGENVVLVAENSRKVVIIFDIISLFVDRVFPVNSYVFVNLFRRDVYNITDERNELEASI